MRRPPATIDKSHTTLYSISSNTMISGSGSSNGSTRTQTTASDSNNNLDDDDDGIGIESLNRSTVCVNGDDNDDVSSSEFSYNECDITLIDDEDIFCGTKNDGEMLYCQVVEMLRFEVEVCLRKKVFFSFFLFSCENGKSLWNGHKMIIHSNMK